jgi:hypothetical protein
MAADRADIGLDDREGDLHLGSSFLQSPGQEVPVPASKNRQAIRLLFYKYTPRKTAPNLPQVTISWR